MKLKNLLLTHCRSMNVQSFSGWVVWNVAGQSDQASSSLCLAWTRYNHHPRFVELLSQISMETFMNGVTEIWPKFDPLPYRCPYESPKIWQLRFHLFLTVYRKYISNNALVYVSLLILTHIAYYRFVFYFTIFCIERQILPVI